jgi:hypothetical protein
MYAPLSKQGSFKSRSYGPNQGIGEDANASGAPRRWHLRPERAFRVPKKRKRLTARLRRQPGKRRSTT